ncbi:MFS transporter [Thermotoga profunda]|uniref:MFS transporter n=1 Tax=Thermotoga profunda TaxID=1508420 RepID=UPI000597D341|nr:MFS transporter [Thermotoga profunda]
MKFYLNLEGVASTLYTLLTQGAVFTGLALAFGLDEFLIGVSAAFPMIAQAFQVVSPVIMRKFPRRRFLTNLFNILSRSPWILLMIFLLVPNRTPAIFVTIFAFSQIFGTLAGNAWTSLVRDLISEEERGTFFGRRNIYISLVTLVAFYGYSLLIEKFRDPLGYEIVIGIGMVGMLISLWSLKKVPEVPLKSSGALIETKVVFQDYNFMKLCLFYLIWNAVIAFTSPFYSYHLLKNLNVPFSYIGITTVINSLVAMAFYNIWGKLSDKYGHKTIAVLGIIMACYVSPLWILMNQYTWKYLMIVDVIMSGIAWSAINLTFLTLPMEVAHSSSPAYFAMYSTFGGIGGLIGAVLGGATAKALSPVSFSILGIPIVGVQIMFFTASFLRAFTLKFILRVKTKRYVPVRRLIVSALSYISRGEIPRMNGTDIYDISRMIKRKVEETQIKEEKQWRVKRWW